MVSRHDALMMRHDAEVIIMREFIHIFDNTILDFIQCNMRVGILDFVMPYISYLGSGAFIWIVTALVFLCTKKYRAAGVTVIIALLLCGLIGNIILKPLIARPRPYEVHDIALLIPLLTDYSFPSGHTMSSFAASVVIFHKDKLFGSFAFLLGSLIAFSRLYLFVHYPTDILGGIVIGTIIGIIAVFLFCTIKRLKI